jgi:hypothetical protein
MPPSTSPGPLCPREPVTRDQFRAGVKAIFEAAADSPGAPDMGTINYLLRQCQWADISGLLSTDTGEMDLQSSELRRTFTSLFRMMAASKSLDRYIDRFKDESEEHPLLVGIRQARGLGGDVAAVASTTNILSNFAEHFTPESRDLLARRIPSHPPSIPANQACLLLHALQPQEQGAIQRELSKFREMHGGTRVGELEPIDCNTALQISLARHGGDDFARPCRIIATTDQGGLIAIYSHSLDKIRIELIEPHQLKWTDAMYRIPATIS